MDSSLRFYRNWFSLMIFGCFDDHLWFLVVFGLLVLEGLQWSWKVLKGLERSFMVIDGHRWSTIFFDVSQCSSMFFDVLQCSLMFFDVLRCSTIFFDVLRCSSMMFYTSKWSSEVFSGKRIQNYLKLEALDSFHVLSLPNHKRTKWSNVQPLLYLNR